MHGSAASRHGALQIVNYCLLIFHPNILRMVPVCLDPSVTVLVPVLLQANIPWALGFQPLSTPLPSPPCHLQSSSSRLYAEPPPSRSCSPHSSSPSSCLRAASRTAGATRQQATLACSVLALPSTRPPSCWSRPSWATRFQVITDTTQSCGARGMRGSRLPRE